MITSKQLRSKWLSFYESKGHVNIGAVSLIGDGSTGVMFNVAGMQPLMPYLLGQPHPAGKRLCNVQGCVRTVDIESVGDATHFTFFEMMGNWSLGDYFKKEKTAWSFELLTKEFGLDPDKICSTVFAGNESVPRDDETAQLLISLGIRPEHIYYLDKSNNWWELEGTVGTPCGPDNEWFYPLTDEECGRKPCDINCPCGRYVEIGNDVYMQYKKTADGYVPLENKNVDTGFGLDLHIISDDGSRWKTLPVGRDGIEFCQGHQCWRGESARVIASTLLFDTPLTATQELVEMESVPGNVHCRNNSAGGKRNILSRKVIPAHFLHFATDRSGSRIVSDYESDDGEWHLYTGKLGAMGDAADLHFTLNLGSREKSPWHPHPFLSPDGRKAFFNSSASGQLQAYCLELE